MDKSTISTIYDEASGNYIVRFPAFTSLAKLQVWREHFLMVLGQRKQDDHTGLLLDTHSHDFESIACLKFLRSFLQEITQMEGGIGRIAFVQPEHYRPPEIVDSNEAYLSTFEKAYRWLSK